MHQLCITLMTTRLTMPLTLNQCVVDHMSQNSVC